MRQHRRQQQQQRAFTLIELMVVVALVAIVLTLAAPSFSDFIVTQRLKAANAALVTDLRFARSEAVSRGAQVRVRFQSIADGSPHDLSCYIIFAEPTPPASPTALCDCKAAEGSRCADPGRNPELRTVLLPASLSVNVAPTVADRTNFAFDPRTGGLIPITGVSSPQPIYELSADIFIDGARIFRNNVTPNGRQKVCIPAGSTMTGDAC